VSYEEERKRCRGEETMETEGRKLRERKIERNKQRMKRRNE